MKKVIEYLNRLDFSEQEAKLYLILLKAGSMSVAELANKADINRTAAYGYIGALLKKGVISKTKGTSNKITANPPDQLHYLVDQKISTANVLREELSPIVTLLNASFLRSQSTNESETHYFKGKNSVKAIYSDVLKSDKIRAYFNPDDIENVFPENKQLFDEAIERNTQLEVYEIVQNTAIAYNYIDHARRVKRHYWKFLPNDIKLTANDILLYDGKVAIINIGNKDNVNGIVLENKDYYNNSVQLFDLLWRLLPNSHLG